VLNDQVVEGSLGYFINPLATVALGVIFLRERLRPAQWVALGISVVAIVVIVVGYGSFPWIALALAFSFGLYGFVKKRVGAQVDALSGLTLETALLTPVAIVQLIVVGATVGLTFGNEGVPHAIAMIAAGAITATPLLLFAAAARRLSLVSIGLTQFLAPVLQFLFGVYVLHEAMPPGRWAGFALIWLSLIVSTVDMIVAARAARRVSPLPA
jgi:chloramphenicol-sensitive protein RarD